MKHGLTCHSERRRGEHMKHRQLRLMQLLSALLVAGVGAATPRPCDPDALSGGITCAQHFHRLQEAGGAASANLPIECRPCETSVGAAAAGLLSERACALAELTEASPGTTCGDLIAMRRKWHTLANDADASALEEALEEARAAVAQEVPAACGCKMVADVCDKLAAGHSCRVRESWVRARASTPAAALAHGMRARPRSLSPGP